MSKPKYIFNQINEQEVDLLINGEISEWWGVGLLEVKELLEGSGAKKINLQINSPGGSVTEGLAIAAFIKNFPAQINTTVIGLAASIATPIALAGNKVFMDKDSFFMVHNPWASTFGEAEELRETADLLDKMKDNLANVYLEKIKKTGNLVSNRVDSTKKQVIDWMNKETWFTAKEALEAGLIDGIVNRKEYTEEKEEAKSILNSCKSFKNAPVEFLNKFQTIVDMANIETNPKEEVKDTSFWEKFSAMFRTNPKEVKNLINGLEESEKAEEEKALEDAKALLASNGFTVNNAVEVEQATEETQEETIEEPAEEVVLENSELDELKAKLALAEKEIQKIKEENNGGPSAGDGGESIQDKSILKLYAPTAQHKEALKTVGKLFN